MSTSSRFHPDRDPLRPPPAPGLGRGFSLAMAAHVLLVVALSFGVSWRSTPVPALEAELWSAVPKAAAPKEQLPTETQPEPPKEEPKPEPPKPQQPPPEQVQAQRDAEIAIAKAKERKQKEEQAQREADEKQRKLDQLKREKDEADKKERDRKAKEEQARKDDAAKDKAEKAKQDKARKDAEAKAEAQRQENLRRIQGMAGASGGPTSTGTALKSSGPSASYAGRIKARVRPNIIYSDPGGASNPEAEVEVRSAPDGTIIARKIVKPSGLPDFDNAVLRALDKTEKFPPDTDGRVPQVMIITFRPRE
ncbi:cell envelope integrity protein TolA [Roseateles chitosanitabidus]|uniref:cell envelope integrity protein TolA n=1 Tax=Roseateles chitosanitabidus TaxID=65048 RepID=UPI0008317B8A|nr:cell envelope integrity protein TolA [Roseateles chitosanitabidus]MBO9687361.1 cell envelope integrity protein TolA [Roseateles chitosanitabidus]